MASQLPTQPLSDHDNSALGKRLLKEGWSLHVRLRQCPPEASGEGVLDSWRKIVAPDQPTNFVKRLEWDGLSVRRRLGRRVRATT